jgi:hypothetical protein
MNYIDQLAQNIYRLAESPNAAPMTDYDRPLYRMYALLALAKGEAVTRKDVHDAWSAWCANDRPDHRSLVTFDQLSEEVQAMDQPYVDAIHEVARQMPNEDAA